MDDKVEEAPKECGHESLVIADRYTAAEINMPLSPDDSKVREMFIYKKYRCTECNAVITILQAVVEK